MTPRSGVRIISPTFYDRQLPSRKLPRQNTDIWIGYFPNIPYLRVCWWNFARFQVLRHAYKTPDIEIGGILIGGVYRSIELGHDNFPLDFIQITYAIPASQTSREAGSFTFTAESWAEMNSTLDHMIREGSLPNDSQIVGWYHTHPGHGTFLSGHDLFIHNNYFSNEFQCALAIETKQHEGAFFVDSEQKGGPFLSEKFTWDKRYISSQENSGLQDDPTLHSQVQISKDEQTIHVSDTELKHAETQASYRNQSRTISVSKMILLLTTGILAIIFLAITILSLSGGLWFLPLTLGSGVLFLIFMAVNVWQLVTVYRSSKLLSKDIVIDEEQYGRH